MIVTRLVCDGCGVDSGLSERFVRDETVIEQKRWIIRYARRYWSRDCDGAVEIDLEAFEDDDHHLRVHYCPTCRRAVEAEDLRTALVAPARRGLEPQ